MWPDNFDFEQDKTCQTLFKPFILGELKTLEAYDHKRPDSITYIFHEHAERVSENIYRTCIAMNLGETVANNMRWAILPHDIGKQKLPIDIWDREEKPDGNLKEFRRTHTNHGVDIVNSAFHDIEHPFKDLMIEIMLYHHEQMDGGGTHGLQSHELSAPIRLVSIVEAYDGYRIWRPHFEDRDISPPSVLKRMREEKGNKIYDMNLFESFAKMKMDDYKQGRILQNNES